MYELKDFFFKRSGTAYVAVTRHGVKWMSNPSIYSISKPLKKLLNIC